MGILLQACAVAAMLLTLSACRQQNPPAGIAASAHPVSVLEFKVSGMTCTGCEAAITSAVQKVKGVTQCEASHTTGTVKVTTTDPAIGPKVVRAIEALEYTVTPAG